MKPLQTKTGGAIDQGVANESGIIKRLGKFVKELSKNRYEIQKVREFGLLTRRDCGVCSSSPDGIFPLLKRDTDGSYKFISLCVLEMKTRGSTNTVDALTREVENNGKWVECDAGTPLFRTSIPDAAYRSQVCQHAAALGLNKVMLVYSVPGAFVQRVVLVTVSDRQINTLVSLQKVLGETYLPFMSLDDDVPFVLPRLGDDFSPAYGYSQEHHTYHQWMWLARAYAKDVKEKGTPPSCRRFIDLLFSYWNKCMGNIDTIRKVVKEQKAKRGPNSGPGSLAWIHQFDYIFYQAMRVYQHSEIEKQLDRFETFKHLQETKKKACSYSAYLYMLASEDSLNAAHLNNVFPGLREFINRGPIVSIDNAVGGDSSALAVAEELPATTTRPATSYKQAIDFFTLTMFCTRNESTSDLHIKGYRQQRNCEKRTVVCVLLVHDVSCAASGAIDTARIPQLQTILVWDGTQFNTAKTVGCTFAGTAFIPFTRRQSRYFHVVWQKNYLTASCPLLGRDQNQHRILQAPSK